MKRFNRILLFLAIALGLSLAIFLRRKFLIKEDSVSLVNRLPKGEIIVRGNFMDLSKEISSILYKDKLPIREFASPDFLFTQGKQFGIKVQSDSYMFADKELHEWGILVSVTDSSKLIQLVNKFRKSTMIIDSSSSDVRIFGFRELDFYLCYQKNYALIYHGKQLTKILRRVKNSTSNKIESCWKRFLSLPVFKGEKLVAYSESSDITRWGFDYVLASHDNDSINIRIKFYLHSPVPHGIKLRENSQGLPLTSMDTKAIELHLDSTYKNLKFTKQLTEKLHEYGKKISFPTQKFINAWDGNLSFREGGVVKTSQKFIATEFDEDFNPKEVVRFQDIFVPGYSLMYSTNHQGKSFLDALYTKGIIRNEEGKIRFLYSPLLSYSNEKNLYRFTSSNQFTELVKWDKNFIRWSENNNIFTLYLTGVDSNHINAYLDIPSKVFVKFFQKKSKKKF